MDKIRIIGGQALHGTIRIGGAKNASLPLMAASILSEHPLVLQNVPDLADITSMKMLLEHLGVKVETVQAASPTLPTTLSFHAHTLKTFTAPYDIVRKMRASVLTLGPLLARLGEAIVSLPGGCAIGTRPIDLHIKGLTALGAIISLEEGYVHARAPQGLKGASFTFPVKTVTGTENLMMAACLAEGTTQLVNAAKEPEIGDLAHCLNAMGAKISGIDSDILEIEGVKALKGATYSVIPDRIETGTYVAAAAITRGCIDLLGTDKALLPTFLSSLQEAGINITEIPGGIRVDGSGHKPKGVDVTTEPYPGFPTDLQAQMMSLMCLAEGASLITETIFENRFMHVPELQRLGADIHVHGSSALVRGTSHLIGAPLMATDIRASFSLVLAGLAAQGETTISRVYHLDRGYEQVEHKLAQCGANIERIKGD